MTLPVFLRPQPVILIGDGDAAAAKGRVLSRAGMSVVTEGEAARLAVVAIEDEDEATAVVTRLRARGILVNAVDRPALCDFTLPAIVDRTPVLIAIGTGGVSAGLAAALRQRLEALMPASLGILAETLFDMRERLRSALPDAGERRRALAAAMAAGGGLDPLGPASTTLAALPAGPSRRDAAGRLLQGDDTASDMVAAFGLISDDPEDLTIRQARALASADRVLHTADVPTAILDRARADAERRLSPEPPRRAPPGLTVWLYMA